MRSKKCMVPISQPQEGAFGKTGAWRHIRPVIDYSECSKCSICWLYCPDSAITLKEDRYPEIDYLYCKGCGICAQECPRKCIDMEREK